MGPATRNCRARRRSRRETKEVGDSYGVQKEEEDEEDEEERRRRKKNLGSTMATEVSLQMMRESQTAIDPTNNT